MPASAVNSGFDFTFHVRQVCRDMTARLPELAHIDMDRVAVSFSQARSSHSHGLQATLTPMRFEGGATTTQRAGRRYRCQQLFDEQGHERLYILSCYLPRFLNHGLQEKVATLLHELWHISPEFNGDLRRFKGRCYAHGPSQKSYDAQVNKLAQRWWRRSPPAELYQFLRFSFRELDAQCGPIYGTKIPAPKLIPVE